MKDKISFAIIFTIPGYDRMERLDRRAPIHPGTLRDGDHDCIKLR